MARDSDLTFAVVWDPERGLEAYSGCDLLPPISDADETFPESIHSESQMDHERPLSSSSFQTGGGSPKSPSPSSPSSKWTFAALWDSEIGLMAFDRGKLTKVIPSEKHRWSAVSAPPSTLNTEHGYITNLTRGFYLRVSPELGSPTTASSPGVGGHHHQPHFSCFDPLNGKLHFEPHLYPFSQSDRKSCAPGPAAKQGNPYVTRRDHDFSHANDPCLPSRFSISTTSTSAYVPIDPTSVHIKPRITFLGSSRASASPRLRKRGRPARYESEPCGFARLFKNAPWSKGSEDDKWVLVEVQSVVIDRIVDE